jgi:hypothetical protein
MDKNTHIVWWAIFALELGSLFPISYTWVISNQLGFEFCLNKYQSAEIFCYQNFSAGYSQRILFKNYSTMHTNILYIFGNILF